MLSSEEQRDIQSRRKLKRYELIVFLSVSDLSTGQQLGHVVDLNTEGIGLTCSGDVVKGKIYSLSVALPDEIVGRRHFDVDARCMWAVEQRDSGLTLAGFRYDNLLMDDMEIIEQITQRYQR